MDLSLGVGHMVFHLTSLSLMMMSCVSLMACLNTMVVMMSHCAEVSDRGDIGNNRSAYCY